MVIKKQTTVSILTITQFIRFECLRNLIKMIERQTYSDITEWVLVEGSQKKEDADKNKELINNFIEEIKNNHKFKIVYVEYSGLKLGGLRNLGNDTCVGNIIVCMDDDDYYPKERIEEAVNKLTNSKCLIGGVSDVYLYDFFMDRLYKFKGFMEFHSTNNCMAYKKEFLISNRHDPIIEVGEERSFTKEFTIPLVKLDSRKTIIAISHNFNTFNKRELCLNGTLKTLHTLDQIDEPITNYIDEDIFLGMKAIYYKESPSPYDIVYLAGGLNQKITPKDNDLDDAERSLIKLSEYWVKKNKKVAIYGEFDPDTTVNGVKYIHWKKFPYEHVFNILILWRNHGLLNGIPFPIKAKKIIWDSYDNFIGNENVIKFWKEYGYKVNQVFLKSNFHKHEFVRLMNQEHEPKLELLPSGLRIENFIINKDNVERNPYRFCYVNYYDRGIEFIITGIFSVIKKIEPRAELHIYTGMDMIQHEGFKNKMNQLFSMEGVCEHGFQPVEIIAREKYLSSFELYISNIVNEVDCVDIRESLITGCIPLISNFGVFLDREGIKFDINHEDERNMKIIALNILNLMKDKKKLDDIREEFKKSQSIFSYNQVAEIMLQKINYLN